MKTPTSIKNNLENLREMAQKLQGVEYFLFFGTLLGFFRGGNIIDNDDDVDLLVNKKCHPEVLNILISSGYRININNEYIIQGIKIRDGSQTHIDFYFYEDSGKDYIVEKWNFFSRPHDPNFHLHIPKNMIYPINNERMQDFVCKVPQNIELCCSFLYGERFMTPMTIKKDYMVEKLVNNRPFVVYYG
tara:strand:+ start:5174 stop:5737 length:564 start_codon:yes stop_codon:yes gene_type:complete